MSGTAPDAPPVAPAMERPPGTLGSSTPTLRRRFRLRLGIVAVVLGAVAVPTDRIVASAVGDLAEEQAASLAATTATNLREWFAQRRNLAEALAAHPDVAPAALRVLGGDGSADDALRRHATVLAGHFGLDGFAVCALDGTLAFAMDPRVVGAKPGPEFAGPIRKALAGESAITPPEPISIAGVDGLVIVATAPIRDGDAVRGVLALRFDPRHGYMRLFEAARPGATGETYAVDAQGRLASRSRFHDTIRAAGLAPEGIDTAMLRFEVRDPGGPLKDALRADRSALPWTRATAEILAGRAGSDSEGYRGYRGVPVVGAWVPVPEFGLGVVSEIDRREAFRPLVRLRLVFGGLAVLLGAAAVVAVVTMRRSEAAGRRAEVAERKLRELGQYRLERKIGEGAMGSVWLATHRLLRRRTAVKLLKGEMTPEAHARFEREVRITCSLTHPNTVAVWDFGTATDGTVFCAMEYLQGRDLQRLVSEFGPLPPARAIHLLAQAAGSLGEAHAAGLVHRDVKPANLFVCERGGLHDFLKVLDFGIARHVEPGADRTSPGVISGTPLYMAPETFLGRVEPDGRSDLYSLGCVAWFLLTGKPVFEGSTVVATLLAHVNEPLPRLRDVARQPVPADLEGVVLRLLAKAPADRPQDAEALVRELRACADWGRWTNDDARTWWATRAPAGDEAAEVPPADAPRVLATQDVG